MRPFTHEAYDGAGFGDQFWRSTNLGGNWTRDSFLFTRNSERAVVPDPVASKTVYLTAYGSGVYRSVDDGKTWTNPDSLTGTLANHFVRRLVAWPGQLGHLFLGAGDGVWESTNGAATWVQRSGGLPSSFSVRSLALVPGTPATLYAGDDLTGVFKSVDGGQSWVQRSVGLTNPHIRDLAVDARNSQTLYAATDVGVFKSTDGASTWASASTGLPAGLFVNGIVQDATHPHSLFCAVWTAGVFYSQDGAVTWQPLSGQSGLSSPNVHCLAIDAYLRTLYVGTDSGVQTLSNYPVVPTDAESAPVLQLGLAAWPNPARSGTLHVRYTLARQDDVRMAVYDVRGARVRMLQSQRDVGAGAHVLTWDGRDGAGRVVSAGVYFVRLRSGEGERSTRVLLGAR